MNKGGISPLIISVILIGVVFIIGVVVYVWMFGVVEGVEEHPLYSTEFIDFEINYLNSEDCDNSYNNCYSRSENSNYYCLLIKNKENFEVGYIIKTFGESGIDISDKCDILIEPFTSETFRVYYSENVGVLDYAEVLPYKYS